MGALAALFVVVVTIGLTEWLATLVHRHVMHGFGWSWHRSHHEPPAGRLEKNDLYAAVFAVLACALIFADGDRRGLPYWIGIGMTAYGAIYFFVHDWVTHQRWPWRRAPRSGYLKRLVQAHRMHHAVRGRDGAVSFGFLYAPPVRLLKAQLEARREALRDPAASANAANVESRHGRASNR